MADDKGGKQADADTPPGSPPANVDENGNPILTPPGGANNTPAGTQIPFNELMAKMLDDPKFNEYLDRRQKGKVEEGVKAELARMGIQVPTAKDELEVEAQEMAKEMDIDVDQARKLVRRMNKMVEVKTKNIESTLKASSDNTAFQLRIAGLRGKYGDLNEVGPKMLELLKTMDEHEQVFVFNSENGVEYLYDKAGGRKVKPSARDMAAAGSSPGRGSSPISKLSNTDAVVATQASQALARNDKEAYEKHAKTLLANRR